MSDRYILEHLKAANMTDFHNNVFYYYRGAKQRESDRDKQLEDNFTKALINTLSHAGGAVRKQFLEWLGVPVREDDTVRFEMQRANIGEARIARKKKRILLALLPVYAHFEPSVCASAESSGDSRPDAWIYGDEFVVLIESKVVPGIDEAQMNTHFGKLARAGKPAPEYQERLWSEVHARFVEIGRGLDGRDAWLVGQLTTFLEYCNMGDFTGFTTEFFDYFFTREDDDVRKWVRDSFGKFAGRVHDALMKTEPSYVDWDTGKLTLTDTAVWAAYGPKPFRQWAHLTLAADSQGIKVQVNIELKSATDRLKTKIREDFREFRRIVEALHNKGPFELKIEEWTQRQVQKYDYHPIAEIESTYLIDARTGEKTMAFVSSLLMEIPLPYFMAIRKIDRVQAVALSKEKAGDGLIDAIVDLMKALHPLVAFVNEE